MRQERLDHEFRRIIGAVQSADLPRAERLGRQLAAAHPDHPRVVHLLGLVLYSRGAMEEAEPLYRRSLELDAKQANVWKGLGALLAEKGETQGAREAFETALELAPDFEDARAGLITLDLDGGEGERVLEDAEEMTRRFPRSAVAQNLLGRALQQADRLEEASDAFARAGEINPGLFEAHYNQGVVLRLLGRARQAVAALETALGIMPRAAEAYFHMGHALHDLGNLEGALKSYRQAIRLRPDFLAAHEILNKLLWEYGRMSEFLQSYAEAITRAPDAVRLYADYGQYLTLTGAAEKADQILSEAENRLGPHAALSRVIARVRAEHGQWDKAIERFEQAVALDPDDYSCLLDFTRTLIMQGHYDRAMELIERLKRDDPLDQQNLAYEWLCLRLTGDKGAEEIYDYDRFVRGYELTCPEGYDDLAAFNRALAAHLHQTHKTHAQPLDQTLRKGTQTHGLLLDFPDEIIQTVKARMSEAVTRYLQELPRDPDHPFLGRNNGSFEYTGSWSARLGRDGYHINHVHPRGWISSAYYVELPDDLDHDAHEGWIKFGETDMDLGSRETIGKILKPSVGTLVVFPSYMYHGTVPFKSDQPRMTIAFDMIPG